MADEEPRGPGAEIIGPCYPAMPVSRALGWTPEVVTAAVQSATLLELETNDGALLYRAFHIVDGPIVDGSAKFSACR